MNKCKKVIFMAVLLLYCITMGGCWDAKELDDLAIPLVGAYDLVLEDEKEYPDDKYLITIGIPVFYENVEEHFHIVENTGKTIGEARERRNSELGEQIIYGQLQLLLFGEELGKKEDMLEVVDIVSRNPAVKSSLYMVMVKGRAVDLVKKPVHDYPNMAVYLKALLENSKNSNFYPYTTLFQFTRELVNFETSAIVPHVIFKDGDIMLAGACLINKGKVSGDIGKEETEIAVMLRGIKCRGDLNIDLVEDGKVVDQATFEGTNSRKVKVERQGDKYAFNIKIKLRGIIVEHKKQTPINDGVDLIQAFETALEQEIKERAEALVERTQTEFKFDALCLACYIKAYTREKLTKEDIDRIISKSDINIEVEVQIKNAGGKL